MCSRFFQNIDFSASPYKFIPNRGIAGHDTFPYNIDAIAGATQTVERPGVQTSIPLSIREIENANHDLARGVYTDSRGSLIYEGLDLYHMLTGMREGDNGIILTDTAYGVELKNYNRQTIAALTLADIQKAHDGGRPVLIAYGMGVDAAGKTEHALGYIAELGNDSGCLKLVQYGAGNDYDTFSNVAYVYLREQQEPGFKHIAAEGGVGNRDHYSLANSM